MKRLARSQLIGFVCGAGVAGAFASMAWAGSCFLCRKPAVDMPVSLAVGSVRSPEFAVKNEHYLIYLQVERSQISSGELGCMIGIARWPNHCSNFGFETVLEANWKVVDGNRVVAQGSVQGRNEYDHAVSDKYLQKYLASFDGESGKKNYVLEVQFTKDGSALNVTNPHLIVMMTKPTDI